MSSNSLTRCILIYGFVWFLRKGPLETEQKKLLPFLDCTPVSISSRDRLKHVNSSFLQKFELSSLVLTLMVFSGNEPCGSSLYQEETWRPTPRRWDSIHTTSSPALPILPKLMMQLTLQ